MIVPVSEISMKVHYKNDNIIAITINNEEYVCHVEVAHTNENKQTVNAMINGKKERFSYVSQENDLHIFTKVFLLLYNI